MHPFRNSTFRRWTATIILGYVLAARGQAAPAAEPGVFGESSVSETAMMGIFYDLKQTQDHKPTNVDPVTYWKVLDEFLSRHWDESVLNRYYRSSRPLYTTQIFIPNMNANLAPKAFGADKSVKPSRWIIHYKAQVSSPESGTYRFVGGADDIIAVAVNGKTVLVSPLHQQASQVMPLTDWKTPEWIHAAPFSLCNGDWVELKQNQIIDLDVIIGERPGGNFNAFLMVEKQGGNYERDARKHEILPIFQVAAFNTPPPNPGKAPAFAKGYAPWKSYQ